MCRYDRERTDDWGLNLTQPLYLEPLGGHPAAHFFGGWNPTILVREMAALAGAFIRPLNETTGSAFAGMSRVSIGVIALCFALLIGAFVLTVLTF